MLTVTLLLLASATPVKLGSAGFSVSPDPHAQAEVWLERFAEVMRRGHRVEVTTPADVAQVLGLERQRQLLGCSNDSSECIAELANALGVDGVLVGTITRSGDTFLAVVKVVRQPTGKVWWSASQRLVGESALFEWLDQQAEASVEALAPSGAPPIGPLLVAAAGVALGVTGGVLLGLANTQALTAVRTAADEPALAQALASGRTQQATGVVLLTATGVALTASVVWALARSPSSAVVAIGPLPGGAFVAAGGSW